MRLHEDNNIESDIDIGIGKIESSFEEMDLKIDTTFLLDCSDGQFMINGKSNHYVGDQNEEIDSEQEISPYQIGPGSEVDIDIDTLNGNLSFSKNGESFGFALENNEKLKEGGFFLIVMLFDLNDRLEIV
jgi:hypothetical protein